MFRMMLNLVEAKWVPFEMCLVRNYVGLIGISLTAFELLAPAEQKK